MALITFEGVDGCGKSTQLRRAADWLQAQGIDVITTFEPGDTGLGRELRRLLLSGEAVPVPEAELLLFLADRAQHVREVVEPALRRGAFVLCDRFSDSTLAYQLAARSLAGAEAEMRKLVAFAQCGVVPDLTFWFDLPVADAAERMRAREVAGGAASRLDAEHRSFHQRVAEAFCLQWQREPERIVRVDASRSIDEIADAVRQIMQSRLIAACSGGGRWVVTVWSDMRRSWIASLRRCAPTPCTTPGCSTALEASANARWLNSWRRCCSAIAVMVAATVTPAGCWKLKPTPIFFVSACWRGSAM